MSYFKQLTFLKVLTTIAWADGEITQSELNILKSFFRKFNLEKWEMDELKPYLSAPVSRTEQEELYRQLISELSSSGERQEMIHALESMANAGKRIGAEEKELIDRFQNALEKTSFTRRSLGKFHNLLQRTIFQNARQADPELQKYFKRQVFHKIELKERRHGHKINLPENRVYSICLFGTLIASVAHVDGHFDDDEKKALKKILAEKFDFSRKEINLLIEVIAEQIRQGFDFHEVVTEINRLTSFNDRLNLVDCFFAVAVADGSISHEEGEEIRRITKAMRIPHRVFIESKMKALETLR